MYREYIDQLLNGCFHQDWMEEASEPSEVLDNFVETSGLTSDQLQTLASDLRELALQHEGHSDDWLLDELRCDFDPSGSGLTASQWLRDLAQQLIAKKGLAPQ